MPYLFTNPAGYNIEASITLKLLHGHIFIMGSVIPVVMAAMLIIGMFNTLLSHIAGRIIGAAEIRVRSLRISVGMYMLGIFGSLVLQFAKVVLDTRSYLTVTREFKWSFM